MRLLNISEVQSLLLNLMKDLHVYLEQNQLQYYLLGGSALGAVRHDGFIPWDDDIDIGMKRDDYEKFLAIADRFNPEYEVINFKKTLNCDFGLTRIYIPNTYINNPSIEKTKLDKRLYLDIFPLDNVPADKDELAKYEKKIVKFKKIFLLFDVRDYGDSKCKLAIKKCISCILKPFRKKVLFSFDKTLKKYWHTQTEYICSLCSQYSFKKQVMLKSVYGTPALRRFEDTELYVPEQTEQYLTTLFGADYMEVPPVEKRRKGLEIYYID